MNGQTENCFRCLRGTGWNEDRIVTTVCQKTLNLYST